MYLLSIKFTSIASLLLALLILVAYLTQANNIQIIALQRFYWTLNRTWGLTRATINLLVSLATIGMSASPLKRLGVPKVRTCLVMAVCGLIIGLAIYSAETCCDNPVVFYFGFPFSWLRGVTNALHYLPTSSINYLLQHFDEVHWSVQSLGMFVDFLFWINVSSLFVIVSGLRGGIAGKKALLAHP
jgi:hypothetical protein